MINSISLQNCLCFGTKQTIPLEAITVLIGPNGSGKSSFMRVADLVHPLPPPWGALDYQGAGLLYNATKPGDRTTLTVQSGQNVTELTYAKTYDNNPVEIADITENGEHLEDIRDCWDLIPLLESRRVKLCAEAIRAGLVQASNGSQISEDGAGSALVLWQWQQKEPALAEELNVMVKSLIPDICHVKSFPDPYARGRYQLWAKDSGGEFPARLVADSTLLCTALCMHLIEAEPESIVFIESPESGLHPCLLHGVVELFRRVHDRKACQFVIATHSPYFLDEFRDEPESILLFRRSEEGTRVTQLSEAHE
jgi:predicted ATPase